MVERYRRSMASKPAASTSSALSAWSAMARSIEVASAADAKSLTRRNSRPAMRGVPRARRAISLAPSGVMPIFSTRAPRVRQQSRARRRADQGEFCKLDLDRARRRSLADDEVELEILHRRIEHF